jgi:inner membrane protein
MGHRGFTHSLFFAALLAALVVALFFRGSSWLLMWLYFFVATASHGILDAMTNGGLGVAFFAPFDNARYFFPFRPIQVSPLHVHRFFSARGAAILLSELKWVIAPSVLFGVLCLTVRSRFGSKAAS